MKDFVRAALPFVLAGIAVIILCVGNQKKPEAENAKAQERRLAFGMLLGLGCILPTPNVTGSEEFLR